MVARSCRRPRATLPFQDDVAHGRFPLISWGCSSAQGTTFQAIANGSYDTSVVIPAALAVKALATNVFIRPSWEFNLNVNNPSGNPNGNNCYTAANVGNVSLQAAEYIAYFQHLVQVFAAQGVANVTWVWCPAVSTTDFQTIPIDTFYPGSASVDWIAGDTYDKTTQPVRGFVGIWSTFWSHYSSFGKPLMIAETGEVNNATDGFTQQKYFDDAGAALQPGGAFNLNSGCTNRSLGVFRFLSGKL
jgi:beta-mannanase